jgi:hypothetical protein
MNFFFIAGFAVEFANLAEMNRRLNRHTHRAGIERSRYR